MCRLFGDENVHAGSSREPLWILLNFKMCLKGSFLWKLMIAGLFLDVHPSDQQLLFAENILLMLKGYFVKVIVE